MKTLFIISLAVLFISCNKDNSLSPSNLTSPSYLGLANTTREYESTTWEYNANTETPHYNVPDSLIKKLSFDSSSLKQGLVRYERYKEILINRDTSFNQLTHYNPSIRYFQKRRVDLEKRDLEFELAFAKRGEVVPNLSLGSGIDGTLFIEDESELYTSYNDTTKYIAIKKPLEIGLEWIREKHQYKNNNGVYETFREECKVISKEEIVIKAGKFTTFKVEVSNNWVDLNYKAVRNYEYYVLNVGLVLVEWDMNLNSYNTITNLTDYFRQKYRLELVSYSFINN